MVTNKKVFGKAMSMPAGIGLGLLISLGLLLAGCAAMAGMMDREVIMREQIGYAAMAVLFFSAVLGSATAVILIKHRRLLVGALHGSCYLGALFLINGLLFGGSVTGGWVTAALLYGASCCAPILFPQGKGQKKIKLKKVHTG